MMHRKVLKVPLEIGQFKKLLRRFRLLLYFRQASQVTNCAIAADFQPKGSRSKKFGAKTRSKLTYTVRKTRVMFVFLSLSFHYPPCKSECSEVEYPLRRGAKYNLSDNRDESVRECTL